MTKIRIIGVAAMAALLASASALAGKPVSELEGHVVGHATELSFSPDLTKSVRANDRSVWTRHVFLPGATYIKLHFADVNLRKGDTLTITNPKGRVIETITRRGPKDMGSFWALSVPGDRATATPTATAAPTPTTPPMGTAGGATSTPATVEAHDSTAEPTPTHTVVVPPTPTTPPRRSQSRSSTRNDGPRPVRPT